MFIAYGLHWLPFSKHRLRPFLEYNSVLIFDLNIKYETMFFMSQISELAGHAVSILDQHVKIKRPMPIAYIGGAMVQAKRLKRVPPTGHATHPK